MAKVSVYNIEGNQVGEMELNDAIFGVEINNHLVHMGVSKPSCCKTSGHTECQNSFRCFRWWKETVETERNWSCKTGFNKSSSVDRRRRSIRSQAKKLRVQDQ